MVKRGGLKGERRIGRPYNNRFGWMTPRARAWRERVKKVVLVLKYQGTAIAEENIKDLLGPKCAWKMGKLFESVHFEVGIGRVKQCRRLSKNTI